MKESTAAIVGFLVAPVPPALMFGLSTPVIREGPDLIAIMGLFIVGYFFAALATGVFAVPAFFLGRRLRLIRWWSALTVGFAIGAAVAVIIQLPAPVQSRAVIFLALMGAASALIFWIIWEQRRPKSET